ncbi:hypothetical protein SDC9_161869 [bioreactor metagenome]|uniref:Uncharacterized protein n=1 Tax=bioreactor metagenome TaxID=1076179 RepID=A0A645FLV6_9ZZZZ
MRQLHRGIDVDAREHAVAADVGVDDRFHTPILVLLGQVHHLVAGELAPAVGGNLPVLGIQANDDVAAKGAAGIFQEAGVLDRSRADDDVAHASVNAGFDGVQITDTTAELHGDLVAHFLQDGLDGTLVLGLTGESAVQVHKMQAARSGVRPTASDGGRVFTKNRGLVHIALFEAHALAVLEVDGGDEQHGRKRERGESMKVGRPNQG